mgnify:CR=1 FL=1
MSTFTPLFDYLVKAETTALSPEVLAAAKRAVIDTVAVMIAGSSVDPLPGITKRPRACGGYSTIVRHAAGYPAEVAAFYNATASHVLDMDDWGLNMGHPSAVIVPALISVAEELDVSGTELLKAYAAAIGSGYALGKQCYYKFHALGWHATSIVTPMIGAFGCGVLKKFNQKQFESAMTIAASFAGGVRGNFGTPVKPLHAGLAARNAVTVSQLAEDGVSGSGAAITGKEGFFRLFGNFEWTEADTEAMSRTLEEVNPLVSPCLTIKLWPSCSSNHQATFAFLDILKEHPEITPESIAKIDVYLNRKALTELVTPNPKTGVEARFSPAFHFALALNKIALSPDNFCTEVVMRPDVRKVIDMTTLHHDPQWDDHYPWPATVVVTTKDGQTFKQFRIHPDGGGAIPLQEEQLREKFENCTLNLLGKDRCDELYKKLSTLETIPSIRDITSLL